MISLNCIQARVHNTLDPGEQEWEAFATVLLSSPQNLLGTNYDANMDFSSQHDVSATWKLSEKIDPEEANSTYITNYPMQYS